MDRNIRVTFWLPTKQRPIDSDFDTCLNTIGSQTNVAEYTECPGGVRLRVERLNFQSDYVEGDFIRQQVDNVPPIATQGVPLLPNPNPIGHRAAFRYDRSRGILAIQAGRPGVSVAAVNSYVRRRLSSSGHRGFFMDPCLSADALERIRSGTARRFELRVARPTDLSRVDPNLSSVEDSLAHLQEFVDGQTVNIGVGFERGDRSSALNLRRILQLVGWASDNRAQVKKLTVKLEEESDPIDVLAERLDRRGVIDLDQSDLDAAFRSRIEFVRGAFLENQAQLDTIFGAVG